jgi:hypothetical protein
VAEQPLQELELLEEGDAGVDMNECESILKAQALISFLTSFCPQNGHSTSGSLPNTSFSKSLSQPAQ